MPDQYVLSAFQRLALAGTDRRPVMAEIDLVSSHTPFTPRPGIVDWPQVGDGSIFDPLPSGRRLAGDGLGRSRRRAGRLRRLHRLHASPLTSWIQTYGNDNLVLVVLGDHQAALPVDDSASPP